MKYSFVVLTGGEGIVDCWEFIIKNVYASCLLKPSSSLLTNLRTCLLCHYVLDVATISSTTFLKPKTQVRNDMATHVFFNPSAQLNEHSSHLKFVGWISREQNLLQETP